MDWKLRRQLLFLGIAAVLLVVIAVLAYYIARPLPSCFDGKKNQDETGVDCGGLQCRACLDEQPKDIVVLWTRFFEVRPGVYDVAALVENPNLLSGTRTMPYTFKLLDGEGATLATKRGEAYALASERFLIFESGLAAVGGDPRRVTFEIKNFEWIPDRKKDPPLRLVQTTREFDGARPRFTAVLKNDSILDVRGVDVSVVVSDIDGNALAVASSHVDKVADSASEQVVFTWPAPFPTGRPAFNVDVFIRKRP